MKKVLVTGAAGFIGRHCVPFLTDRGYEVHGVLAPREDPLDLPAQWHRADLLDELQTAELTATVEPSHLLHFAWYNTPGLYWDAPENLSWLKAGVGLLQSFHIHGGRRAVMAGTCAEYDWRYGLCTEDLTPTVQTTLYAASKGALRSILYAFSRKTGLSSAWGRIFFLFGPFEHPSRLVSSVIRSLLKGEVALCTHGRQQRDFLHVEDVARAFAALLDSEVNGSVNIASGEPVAVRDVVMHIARNLDRDNLVRF